MRAIQLAAGSSALAASLYLWRRHLLRAARLDARGFLAVKSAATPHAVAEMCAAIEAEAAKVEGGGYIIWTPAENLPGPCRKWAAEQASAILQRSLPPGTPAVRLLGGAALWKRASVDDPTPWHQDFAYQSATGFATSRKVRHAAVWLALSPTDSRSGCLRFAPKLGYSCLEHTTLPRAQAPSGFETHMTGGCVADAEANAEDCALEAGSAVIIGDQVVHGSHACVQGERSRLAFSPLFEVDCADCPLPAGKRETLASYLLGLLR